MDTAPQPPIPVDIKKLAEALSPTQRIVMRLMSGKHTAYQSHGLAMQINGETVCNLDTIKVLERKRLVVRVGSWRWGATELGLSLHSVLQQQHLA